jgi:hypothetical protein
MFFRESVAPDLTVGNFGNAMSEFCQKSESRTASCGPAAAGIPIPIRALSGVAARNTHIKQRATKEEREGGTFAMRITKHEKSYIVELSDGSAWRIWPADMAGTLQRLPTTEIDVKKIDDEICSHALINRSDGSQVRVIKANREWPLGDSLRSLRISH